MRFRQQAAPGAQLVNLYGSTEASVFCTIPLLVLKNLTQLHSSLESCLPSSANQSLSCHSNGVIYPIYTCCSSVQVELMIFRFLSELRHRHSALRHISSTLPIRYSSGPMGSYPRYAFHTTSLYANRTELIISRIRYLVMPRSAPWMTFSPRSHADTAAVA